MSGSGLPKNDAGMAVVLAGSRGPNDPVAEAAGKSLKAFAEVEGKPMIQWVTDALKVFGSFRKITLCLPEGVDLGRECPGLFCEVSAGSIEVLSAADSPASSVGQALKQAREDELLWVTTADHPLLNPAMLAAFYAGVCARRADAYAALTSVDRIREVYPDLRRTALHFKDGDYTGCNLFAFRGVKGRTVVDYWRQLEALRKQPVKIARFLGVPTLLQYRLGRLTTEAALKKLGRKTGARLEAVFLPQPEAGIDVDTPEDWRTVSQIIRQQG